MRSSPALAVALVSIAAVGATCKGSENRAKPADTGAAGAPAENPVVRAPEITEIEGFDTTEIPPDSRRDFWRILNETFCYCGCPRTIAACLAHKADCSCTKCSDRMARFVIEQYRGGASTEDVDLQIVEGFTEGYNSAPKAFDLADHGSKGADKAKYTLVEFADFRCSHCKEAAPVIEETLRQHPDVKVVYFYFPLGNEGSPSVLAAEAAEEARLQGKFWEMHELLFKYQHAVEEENLIKYGAQIGLDMDKFKAALQKRTHKEKVLADKRIGEKAGVQATPTIFVNGRPFGLARSVENMKLRLDMESERGKCE